MLQTGNRNQGFTFVEILVVMLIMGVSMAVIIPSMGSYLGSVEVKSTQRGINNLLLQCRKKAVISGNKQIIEIGDSIMTYSPAVDKEHVLEISMEVVEKSTSEVVFNPDGTCSGLNLTLRDENNLYYLEVDKITGDISWGG